MENQYFSRWYDKDPVLSMSIRTLANSSDEKQIAVALNLIKVIIEHNIQDNKYENVEDIMAAVEDGRIQRGHSRWYDIDTTVRTAIQMLEKCPAETRKKVALDMAQIVIEKIIQDEDKDELEKEEAQALKNDSKTIEIDGKIIDLDLDSISENE
ncbi:MAG: hypothetical protein IJB79_01415 [Candidatus Gastranaerophilales bacterium]|nr:hypothetical protein [Candidatus Gastranaerophilales bacterium]